MRHAFNDQPHFAFENVNDLLLWMRMCRHLTTRCECGEHLIHRIAVRDGPARDSRANFNRRIFLFHVQNATREALAARISLGSIRASLARRSVREGGACWFESLAVAQFTCR